jgi:hypothetical protein
MHWRQRQEGLLIQMTILFLLIIPSLMWACLIWVVHRRRCGQVWRRWLGVVDLGRARRLDLVEYEIGLGSQSLRVEAMALGRVEPQVVSDLGVGVFSKVTIEDKHCKRVHVCMCPWRFGRRRFGHD